ncbi:5-formyltetrahydrofolate cyclo-ligase [Deinococcus sp. KSM4-11]|uniref:5-formyltetrahydrofolate cyclo-ligase n=1 Tax=Deinococcus sp. KSM4-11 TaxID=2568654 RepID=UPI0010A43AAE|nr:5-formyltetrahydrofolate cyclo-ligase [Deinococcus sp. KSM4-11]THF85887.1 5-formyltetrahydrofolate cyclo-ligase [Deinococcus sp. KSM4-11]
MTVAPAPSPPLLPHPPVTAGAYREQVWTALLRAHACGYPLPPHGHHPNFKGARPAAQALLTHPDVAALRVLIVGPERALQPLRKLALQAGVILYVPHQKKEGWYWRLTDPAGARLSAMPHVGEAVRRPEGAQGAVIACVAVDDAGQRLGKGFGWAARGLKLGLPEFTLAHPLMMTPVLPCAADSRVALIGTPGGVIGVRTPAPDSEP